MKKSKDITIYDIAEELQISSSTVSRALNESPLVSKNTIKKVKKAAKEMGYQPNTFASNLRQMKTFTIGVIMHELESTFMTSVLSGIERITSFVGYDIIIAHSSESFEKEKINVENLFKKRVDGIIASLSFDTDTLDHYAPLIKKGIPIVFYDRVKEDSEFPKVIIDNFKAGFEATEHLIEQGCSRIVLVTNNLSVNVYAERHRGYQAALNTHGISPQKEWLIENKDLSEKSAIAAAEKILNMQPCPDGVFVTHDFSAATIMKTLQNNGIRVPEEVALVGFNNDAVCKITDPQLSTIDYPGDKVGEAAANYLINRLERPDLTAAVNTIIIKSKLIKRGSSLRKTCEEI